MGLSEAAQTSVPAQKVSSKIKNHTLTFHTNSTVRALNVEV